MGLNRGIMVMDTGFFSRTNLEHLIKRGLSFIIPCKRNSRLVPQITVPSKNFFMYRGRAIKHTETEAEGLHLYLFEDAKLRYEEETTYYTLIEQGKRKFKEEDTKNFGRIFLLSNLTDSPQQIYLMYKSREEIEFAFNLLKNVMEVDRSYLRDNETLSGYLFINFISLYFYYLVLNLLQKKELNSKLSVRDLLLELSKVYVVECEDKELISEIPKKANCLIQLLGYDLFPKLRES
jgi:transposase